METFEYVEIKVRQADRICSPVALDDRCISTWIEQAVKIYMYEFNEDGLVTDLANIGRFTVYKSGYNRRSAAGLSLFDDFDMEFPSLCGLIPAWRRDDSGKYILCDDGWTIGTKQLLGDDCYRDPQPCDIYIINDFRLRTRYMGYGYGIEALAIYINAYCECDSFVFLDKEELDSDRLTKHFARLGFIDLHNGYMLKDCEQECSYKFRQAD